MFTRWSRAVGLSACLLFASGCGTTWRAMKTYATLKKPGSPLDEMLAENQSEPDLDGTDRDRTVRTASQRDSLAESKEPRAGTRADRSPGSSPRELADTFTEVDEQTREFIREELAAAEPRDRESLVRTWRGVDPAVMPDLMRTLRRSRMMYQNQGETASREPVGGHADSSSRLPAGGQTEPFGESFADRDVMPAAHTGPSEGIGRQPWSQPGAGLTEEQYGSTTRNRFPSDPPMRIGQPEQNSGPAIRPRGGTESASLADRLPIIGEDGVMRHSEPLADRSTELAPRPEFDSFPARTDRFRELPGHAGAGGLPTHGNHSHGSRMNPSPGGFEPVHPGVPAGNSHTGSPNTPSPFPSNSGFDPFRPGQSGGWDRPPQAGAIGPPPGSTGSPPGHDHHLGGQWDTGAAGDRPFEFGPTRPVSVSSARFAMPDRSVPGAYDPRDLPQGVTPAYHIATNPAFDPRVHHSVPELDWRGDLYSAISRLHHREAMAQTTGTDNRTPEEQRREAVALRMLRTLTGDRDGGMDPIASLPGDERELWRNLNWSLSELMAGTPRPDADTASPRDPRDSSVGLAALRRATRHYADLAPLQIPTLKLTERIDGFGLTRRISPERLRSGGVVLVYAEIENLVTEVDPTADPVAYLTRIRSEIEIREVDDPQKSRVITSIPFGMQVDRCDRRRTDYFHSYEIELPELRPGGEYSLHLRVEDRVGGKFATSSLTFRADHL